MIVYSGTLRDFHASVLDGIIADRIVEELKRVAFFTDSKSEYKSWDQSLKAVSYVLKDPDIHENLHVAIEYRIPATNKRVDFILSGLDELQHKKAVIIELKQWEKATRTNKADLVQTFLAGRERLTTHPSYQAYSYAQIIRNYNERFHHSDIELIPCAYLHNYTQEYAHELLHEQYQHIIQQSPVFLKKDGSKLQAFIKRHIKTTDHGKIIEDIEHGKIRPSKALQDAVASMLRNNEEFVLIDEQKVVYSSIVSIVEEAVKNNKKHTIIVQGGPGTGKSVLAINLLATLTQTGGMVNYVTKNSTPRNVYFSKLRKSNFKNNYINNLFKGSGAYIDAPSNSFQCLLVDEAHRLNQKSGMFQNLGESQIKEIINASLVSVFFIDEDQIVTTKDYGSIQEITKNAQYLNSTVITGDEYVLASQFRCNGSDGYIAFLDHILGIRETANYDGFEHDYEFKVFNNPNDMREALRQKNSNNKARMVAGYCYNWISQKDNKLYDIELNDTFKAQWNFSNTNTWAIDEDSFDQVGCIHTSQGIEFDYVGVIIGKDLYVEDGRVKTNPNARAKTDQSLKGLKSKPNPELADRIIRNTYKTLMSRGQKGCYVYCEDIELSRKFKNIQINIKDTN